MRPLERSSGRTIPLRVQEADLRSSSLSVIIREMQATTSLIYLILYNQDLKNDHPEGVLNAV